MRRWSVIAIAPASLAGLTAGASLAAPYEVSLATIETESVTSDTSRTAPAERERLMAEPSSRGNPLWAVPLSKLIATRNRPLFSESRRPLAPAVPAAPTATQVVSAQPAAPQKPPFALVGTIVGAEGRIAILFDQTSNSASGLRQGDSALGWTLRSVDPGSATLEATGRIVTLELPRPEGEETPAPRVSEAPSKGNLNSDGL